MSAGNRAAVTIKERLNQDRRMQRVWSKLEKLAPREHWRNRLLHAICAGVRRADMWEENRQARYKRRFAGRRPAAKAKTRLAEKLTALADDVQI